MKNEECVELKNIEYQTMLLNHSVIKKKSEDNNTKIESYLNNEKNMFFPILKPPLRIFSH